MAPGSETDSLRTAAVNAFTPATKPDIEVDHAVIEQVHQPGDGGERGSITKVSEMVRSTLTPSSAAILLSCSQARWERPSEVRVMMKVKALISTTSSP